jgi:hypothetical protein
MKIVEIVSLVRKMESALQSKTVLKSKFVYGIRKNLTTMKPTLDEFNAIGKDFQFQVDALPEDKRQEKATECNKIIAEHGEQDVDISVFTVPEEFLPEEAEAFILDVAYTIKGESKKA